MSRETDSINSGVYEEEAYAVTVTPRVRTYKQKARRSGIVDRSKEKEEMRLLMIRRLEEERKLLGSYIHNGRLEFASLPVIEPSVRDMFLLWLSKALERKNHCAKTEDGQMYYIEQADVKEYCMLKCTDGTFQMLLIQLCLKMGNQNENVGIIIKPPVDLKSRERELYYQVKEALSSGEEKKFLMEKLGYQVIVNPYMIKVEKMPAVPENWMGILEFKEPIEYVFFCLVLMFLEDKEAEEQFVLSELTEYVQSQYQEEQIDWTVYRYRRHMIKVMKYCVVIGILNVDDGSEEGFAKDDTSEVLYENTGASRYFMKNFTQDIMGYTSAKEFEKEEWIDVNEDRGIVRRQRVYRKLLMSMGMYKDAESEEDFAYLRNYRNMIQGDLAELFDCELHVHSSSAFLVLGEECRLGRCFPEGNTLSDVVLLTNQLIQKRVTEGRNYRSTGRTDLYSKGSFFVQLWKNARKNSEKVLIRRTGR